MNKNHELLIKILLDASFPISSSLLSRSLDVSVRSIKNYIDEINRGTEQKVILSFPNGYSINKSLGHMLINNKPNSIPQDSQDRSHYIIKRLLIDHDSNLDIFSLADDLYISDSTLRTEISKMNSTFNSFNIIFEVSNNKLSLSGNEKSKRRLVSFVLSHETKGNFMNTSILKKTFNEGQIELLSKILDDNITNFNYYLNDFALMNLILHLAIIINRIHNGKTIYEKQELNSNVSEELGLAVKDLILTLEQSFSVEFNNHEIQDINMLFSSAASFSNISYNEIEKSIDGDILKLAKLIVHNVKNNYFIDLNSESFVLPFSLHLQKLKQRIDRKSFTPNPMIDTIKNSCPLIYDIAVSISLEIEKFYNYLIPENEITFIALHLGSEIEQQELNTQKISTLVLCPDYGNLKEKLFNNLQREFGNSLNILKIGSNESFMSEFSFDLLITTADLPRSEQYQTIKISPFLNASDISFINSSITSIRHSKKNNVLKEHFENFFSSNIFSVNPKVESKYEAIHHISEKLVSFGHVDNTFEKQVLERERAGSTAFINIAIPHSVKADAYKTTIGVIIEKSGLKWDGKIVNIVYLIAINAIDKKIFNEMYEALVLISSNEEAVRLISESTSFEDFKNVIMLLISNEQHNS